MTDLGQSPIAAAAGACLGTCTRVCMKAKEAVCLGAVPVDNSVHARCVRLMSRVQINTSRSWLWFVVVVHQ